VGGGRLLFSAVIALDNPSVLAAFYANDFTSCVLKEVFGYKGKEFYKEQQYNY